MQANIVAHLHPRHIMQIHQGADAGEVIVGQAFEDGLQPQVEMFF